jgi:hypothetical protein
MALKRCLALWTGCGIALMVAACDNQMSMTTPRNPGKNAPSLAAGEALSWVRFLCMLNQLPKRSECLGTAGRRAVERRRKRGSRTRCRAGSGSTIVRADVITFVAEGDVAAVTTKLRAIKSNSDSLSVCCSVLIVRVMDHEVEHR